MHRLGNYDLEFTGRNTWRARVYENGVLVEEVPVAWRDQIIFNKAEKRPETFLVWFTNEAKAEEFLSRGGGQLISLASARDPNAHPRVFKEFVSLYRVTPFKRDGKRVLATYDAYVA